MGAGGCGMNSYGCGGVRGTGGAGKQDKKRHGWSCRMGAAVAAEK